MIQEWSWVTQTSCPRYLHDFLISISQPLLRVYSSTYFTFSICEIYTRIINPASIHQTLAININIFQYDLMAMIQVVESVTRNRLDCLQFTLQGAALPWTLHMRDVSCTGLPLSIILSIKRCSNTLWYVFRCQTNEKSLKAKKPGHMLSIVLNTSHWC